MTQHNEATKRRVAAIVEEVMGDQGLNTADVSRIGSLDPGTVGDFLNAKRWPNAVSRAKIERAIKVPVGSIEAWARGDESFFERNEPPPGSGRGRLVSEATDLELLAELTSRAAARGVGAAPFLNRGS